jgi:hypothetical protein
MGHYIHDIYIYICMGSAEHETYVVTFLQNRTVDCSDVVLIRLISRKKHNDYNLSNGKIKML